jgi:phosphate starvation-inducible PhoH-like protein|tara:strand:+ start:2164 stop:3129 length:966 start_codon:yes stop_codon:yes gene_type:complete
LNQNISKELLLENLNHIPELFGTQDVNLKQVEKKFGVRITTRENQIKIKGDAISVNAVDTLLSQLEDLAISGHPIKNDDIKFAIRLIAEDNAIDLKAIFSERIAVSPKKGFVTPKSPAQREFIQSVRQAGIVLAIGPAGTGKTYMAVALAVEGLLRKQFKKIILVRPAVEAGEKLGFLPGDIAEKINPYFMPLYDSLNDMMEPGKVRELLEDNIIEIAPLAYMRGRTLSDSFVILDEAQNSTKEQMKMFLTRLGFCSKMVITGDVTQIDLDHSKDSGLIEVQTLLKNIDGIRFATFSEKDVVRHDLVKEIIKAYSQNGSGR